LRRRLDRCAEDWLSECAAQRGVSCPRRFRARAWPWLIAATAFVVAIAGGWPRLVELEAGAATAGGFAQWRAQSARSRMLASPGVEHHAFGGTSEAGSGDVVWDPRTQRGFLRLKGYVANDPARARYQLWIVDAARDHDAPVDGGVFDVPAGRDEVIVPVHPTLPVSRAVAFAVTLERRLHPTIRR
jgi:anti-sigma-K factor RskA